MLSNDENPGVFVFLVGIIVLVMVAVGLSGLVDRRFSWSSRSSSMAREIEAGESELERLKTLERESASGLSEAVLLQRKRSDLESKQNQVNELNRRRKQLVLGREELVNSIQSMEQQFADYRAQYRAKVWAAARGEHLGELKAGGERVYHQAVIIQVTDVGLEIRHENGLARVQATDLDPALQERFQWDDEKRRARLKEKDAPQAANPEVSGSVAVQTTATLETTSPNRVYPTRDTKKTDALRDRIIVMKSKVEDLRSQRSEALRAAFRGPQVSVPGSLETWQARADRLGIALAAAQAELSSAYEQLSGTGRTSLMSHPDSNWR